MKFSFGEALKEARKKQDLTQKDVADFIGLPQAEISRIELGKRDLNDRKSKEILIDLLEMEDFGIRKNNRPDKPGGFVTNFDRDKFAHVLVKKALSYKDIAEEIGVHPATISTWLRGKHSPKMRSYEKLIDFFDEDFDFLVKELDPEDKIQQMRKKVKKLDKKVSSIEKTVDFLLSQIENRSLYKRLKNKVFPGGKK